ncbi:MAG: rod shape-determining protein MreD [Gammaproteobacteria bacterium]|nr:rod shape-determining protein MreD [Gammaproteobacteria bacterium]
MNISILIALVLTIMPLPLALKPFWPDWAAMVVVYWAIALPHRVSIGVAWFVGFLLDVLLGTVLGVHAVSLAVITFGVASNFQRIRNFSVWQQSVVIGAFLVLYHFLVFWLNRFLLNVNFSFEYITPAISSAFFWLWLFPLLRAYRRKFKVR